MLKLFANILLNFDNSSSFILLMLCYSIFMFFVGCSFAWKRLKPLLEVNFDELNLLVDFILLVLEFLDDPVFTEDREEFWLQTERLSRLSWIELDRLDNFESVRRFDIFSWDSYALSNFFVEYCDCWLTNLSPILLFSFWIYFCLFFRRLFFSFIWISNRYWVYFSLIEIPATLLSRL